MANNQNLIPAKKGEIRNPKGKAIGTKNRCTTLKKWLSVKVEAINPETNEPIKVTQEDAIVLALIKKACDGDVPAIKEIQDTLYGKIKDLSELSGTIGENAKTTIIFTKPNNYPTLSENQINKLIDKL